MKRHMILRRLTLCVTLAVVSVFFICGEAWAKVNIVTSVPDFAAIAREIGGDKVDVISLAKGYQDPHFVDAKPIYITKLNRADLLIYNGLDLELGWLPLLVTGARNSNISTLDSPGNLDASIFVPNILEVPTGPIDRSMGDVHPRGNPHYMLDPRNGLAVAKGIAAKLSEIDPENASYYEENYENFAGLLNLKIKEWVEELAPYKGTEIVSYHKNLEYLSDWAGFKEIGFIEPKPGIPPTPSHVAELIKKMKSMDVKLVIASNYYPQKTPSIIAEQTGAAFLSIPTQVEGQDGIDTYFDLFDAIVGEITGALKDQKGAANNSASGTDG
ncbi:MAG TPA: metal ABC transporter substrate-binding protein [Thermodesulfobacteriota bacterium]|nr:metal ABC transporter substrate-binding protein [Thermodesulfobacteriota bacterium]